MIHISDGLLAAICAEGEKQYPDECCGIIYGRLISGHEKYAECLEPVPNASQKDEMYHRFLIPPEKMLQAELHARKCGQDIVGFYHSHPDCEALASEYDRAHACPVYSYIIVSVANGKAGETRSFELTAESDPDFIEEMIVRKKEK